MDDTSVDNIFTTARVRWIGAARATTTSHGPYSIQSDVADGIATVTFVVARERAENRRTRETVMVFDAISDATISARISTADFFWFCCKCFRRRRPQGSGSSDWCTSGTMSAKSAGARVLYDVTDCTGR